MPSNSARVHAFDERRTLEPHHLALALKRATPTMVIVDERLNVLYYREDSNEKRHTHRLPAEKNRLPAEIEAVVRKLIARRHSENSGDVLCAALSHSLLIRAVWLGGVNGTAVAVIFERFETRNRVNWLATRYALSSRERQVLSLLVKGAKNAEIADALQIAPSTAIFHVKSLLKKTDSRNRTEIVSKVTG
ncbi:MAG: hypothetical protein NVS1B14_04650 [Vulcanimicrobiaceae bacterium]